MTVDSERLALAMDAYARFAARFLENGLARGFLRPGLDVEVTSQALIGIMLEGTRRALRSPDPAELRRRWIDAGVAFDVRRHRGRLRPVKSPADARWAQRPIP